MKIKQMIIYRTKSLEDVTPKGIIHVYDGENITRCGKKINKFWYCSYSEINGYKVNCKKCEIENEK